MPCTRRLKAYRGREGGVAFSPRDGYYDRHLELACGQCIDCRLRRARDWALRMQHETLAHEHCSFVTLTYDEENLPEDHSLSVRDWQLFAKRLRKRAGRFRFFHVGEYGERTLRPHYHAILFGIDFHKDRELFKRSGGYPLYTSTLLSEVWNKGHCLIGEASFDSACYVARYCTKKITGKAAAEHYERVDPETGEVWNVKPEYATMSRNPGIGAGYFEKYKDEVYDFDFVVDAGRKFRPPRYYDRLLEREDVGRYEAIARSRRERAVGAAREAGRVRGGDRENGDRSREVVLAAQLKLRKGVMDR